MHLHIRTIKTYSIYKFHFISLEVFFWLFWPVCIILRIAYSWRYFQDLVRHFSFIFKIWYVFHSAVQQTIPMCIINFHLAIEFDPEIIILCTVAYLKYFSSMGLSGNSSNGWNCLVEIYRHEIVFKNKPSVHFTSLRIASHCRLVECHEFICLQHCLSHLLKPFIKRNYDCLLLGPKFSILW